MDKNTLDKAPKSPDKRTEDVLITRAEFEAYKKENLNNIEEIQNKVKESSNQTKELVNDVRPLVKQINSLNENVHILCKETSRLHGGYDKYYQLSKDKHTTEKRPSIRDFLKRSFFKLVLAGILLIVIIIIIYIYYHT